MAHVTDITSAHDHISTVREHKSKGGDAVGVGSITKSINKEIECLPSLPLNCSIYRVPKPQLERKPEAYTPRMVSIGPFHRCKEHLMPMEAHKLWYLNDFLIRSEPGATLDHYVEAMKELEDTARKCYSEILQQSEEEFVKMMVIDGCFILELILKATHHDVKHGLGHPDPISNATWMFEVIRRDLILLENQLPFSVLESLYNLCTRNSNSDYNELEALISDFFKDLVPPQPQLHRNSDEVPKKVFDFWRRLWAKKDQAGVVKPSRKAMTASTTSADLDEKKHEKSHHHLLDFVRGLFLQSYSGPWKKNDPEAPTVFTHCATELEEASVKFEKKENEKEKTCNLLGITFSKNNGVLKIPTILIQDGTEIIFRNLIAFEQQYCQENQFITDYASFIDDLINNQKDVELLQKKGIIQNLLGEPKDVVDLFNGLLKEVTIEGECFYIAREDLEKYYENPYNKWKASLKHDYFKNPWASIACIAAVVLFAIAFLQTVCSILSLT